MNLIYEEKRFIKDIQKNNEIEYKAIPSEFTVWDKIDLKGPNLTIKSLVELFKNKYNVDIEYINYNNSINLASLIDGDEDFNKTIEELIKEKTKVIINEKIKYIKIELSGSIKLIKNGDAIEAGILTPTIRDILNN